MSLQKGDGVVKEERKRELEWTREGERRVFTMWH